MADVSTSRTAHDLSVDHDLGNLLRGTVVNRTYGMHKNLYI